MDARTFHPISRTEHCRPYRRPAASVHRHGLLLSSERSLDVIVQAALDAGLALCGAAYGAFFYNNLGPTANPTSSKVLRHRRPGLCGLSDATAYCFLCADFLRRSRLSASDDIKDGPPLRPRTDRLPACPPAMFPCAAISPSPSAAAAARSSGRCSTAIPTRRLPKAESNPWSPRWPPRPP